MKKTVSLRTLIAIVAFFTASAVCITTMLFAFVIIPKREGELYVYNSKMLEINALVDKYYMGELDDSYMNDCVSYGYLMGLDDRYAAYIPSEEAEESKGKCQRSKECSCAMCELNIFIAGHHNAHKHQSINAAEYCCRRHSHCEAFS